MSGMRAFVACMLVMVSGCQGPADGEFKLNSTSGIQGSGRPTDPLRLADSGILAGGGTVGALAKFTSATTLGASRVSESNGDLAFAGGAVFSGAVGIGIDRALAPLHVLQPQGGITGTYAVRIGMVDGGSNGDVYFLTKAGGGAPSDRLLIDAQYAGASVFNVSADGKAVIRSTNPDLNQGASLHVENSDQSGMQLRLGNSKLPYYVYLGVDRDNSFDIRDGGLKPRFTIDLNNGNTGAAGSFSAGVDINFMGSLNLSGAKCMMNCPSDARLKKNVSPLANSLDRLLRLEGVTYEWKDSQRDPGTHMGFIAQNVEQTFPEWVSTDDSGYKRLLPRGFEALTVEAVRELKNDNDALRRECAELRRQQAAQQQRLERLEAALLRRGR